MNNQITNLITKILADVRVQTDVLEIIKVACNKHIAPLFTQKLLIQSIDQQKEHNQVSVQVVSKHHVTIRKGIFTPNCNENGTILIRALMLY